jgi:hypothetical protein
MEPVVRAEVHDAYWEFAANRQRIFDDRVRGVFGPWSGDEILGTFKFCNTFRAADRVSQYLIREVIYTESATDLDPEDMFLRIVLFRLFSKESTWDALEEATGGIKRSTLDVETLGDLLEDMRTRGPIYTAAFILAAPSGYGHAAKHRNHLALVADMFSSGGLGEALGEASSLSDVYEALTSYPMIGPFLGYQIAIDLNYSEHLDFDENEFTMPGPGALRGLAKVFIDPAGKSPQELIMRMVERQEEEFEKRNLHFGGLFERPLHAIDCQGLFCETDKYSREKFPDLKSNRSRIKQEFAPKAAPIDPYFPPKWGINEKVTAALGDGRSGRDEARPPSAKVDGQLQVADAEVKVLVPAQPIRGGERAQEPTLR